MKTKIDDYIVIFVNLHLWTLGKHFPGQGSRIILEVTV